MDEKDKKHIVWISDLDVRGSGYRNLSVAFCEGLVKEEDFMVKVIGYCQGQEHDGDYSIIPVNDAKEAITVLNNLVHLWRVDVVIVALDIPWQEIIMKQIRPEVSPFKYIGIMPIEADPLCLSWAMVLMSMSKACIISKFGTEEARKVGVINAEYLELGIDADFWKRIPDEEIERAKEILGLKDTYVVLTVADNQERKNLTAIMEAFKAFSDHHADTRMKYVLVTREFNNAGWRLQDYAHELGISNKFSIIERGVDLETLKAIYSIADVFVLASKAEGLGLPLLEAMAMEVPCIATHCTGMKELLTDRRGILIRHEYEHRDPFGNGRRYWINKIKLIEALESVYAKDHSTSIKKARKYVEERKWSIGQKRLVEIVREVLNEQKLQ